MKLPKGWIFIAKPIRKGTAIEIEQRDLIFCGECKHWNEETHGCSRNPSVEPWLDDDFCSYGERSE